MAKKVTQQDILAINRAYLKHKTYAATARETGFSASTVKRYVQPDFIDPDSIEIIPFEKEINKIEGIDWSAATQLSVQEIEEVKKLWKEISI